MQKETAMPQLSPEEQDMLTMHALLGSIDDSLAELEQARRNKADQEVFAKITGKVTDTYTATRESFSHNLAQLYATFEAMEMRMSAMGCNHDHFLQSSLEAYDAQGRLPGDPHNPAHDKGHAHTIREKDTKKTKEKDKDTKRKKVKRLSGWALLGIMAKF